jgi:hypothetical protein
VSLNRVNAVAKPIFCVVLGDATHWSVEAEWPDGTIEQVETFKHYLEAMNWLSTDSEAWVTARDVSSRNITTAGRHRSSATLK